ncbi:hypothetical protein EKK58_02450 [Candidatus Dependentiae bacterium]|nr:MAG: hypothetical protein EKK58_02450 [Candidatus Dependentiae bacterium]
MHPQQMYLLLLLLFSANVQCTNGTQLCFNTVFITKISRLIRKKLQEISKKPKKVDDIKNNIETIKNKVEETCETLDDILSNKKNDPSANEEIN